ncbi:heterokaryon incompatibility protein-domain-containing protein [Podospora aff. communis PSN243]|uniref:Heterokaryon incompatibility protein-domain-containing protein n=1 Tax=Podospora aff. communis PSN243 TaxID=3040156 RepID=A0AAV9GW96_9PEZI|nr:heterokaryon incompatibility protein-domain-containing protein [Podospora aff. communis PSN243]
MDHICRVEHAEGPGRDTSTAPAFQVAAAWLKKCMLEHKHCQGGGSSSGNPLPKRVLDVGASGGSQPLRLHPGEDLSDVYFTFSYRWDIRRFNEASFVTTRANLRSYYFEIPEARLPQVMRDAIQITRQFGVRYLWIDALCIVQDSRTDWACQAKEMAAIYKNATLTIAAAVDTRNDPGAGCFRPRPQRRVRPVYCNMKWPDGSPVYLFADRRAVGSGIRPPSILDDRAWILQEQLLSRRVLTYSDRGLLFWDCAAVSASESFPCGIPMFHDADLSHSELRLFKRFILRERSHEGIDPNPASLAAAKKQLYRHWHRVVEDYSRRFLSYEGDKLMALSGLAKEVANFVEDRLVFGLWEGQLWRDLLWWVKDPATAAVIDTFSSVTWTWAALQGAISFDLARGRARGNILDACLVVREVITRVVGEKDDGNNDVKGDAENDLPNDGRNYGVLTVEGVMVPLLPSKQQPAEPAFSVSHWRPDVSGIVAAEVVCLVVAASERVVYGIGLIPYPDSTNTYGRVGVGQWKGDVRHLGWNRASKKWRRQAKLEILHIM